MSVRYEIEEGTNAVKVFYDDAIVPSLYQPNFPNGDVWADAIEASAWAELYIASVIDEAVPFAPNARGEEGAPKPTAEEIAAMQAELEARNNPSA
jgi:hypothetical protein